MRKSEKLRVFFGMLMLLVWIVSIQVFATTEVQDGLEVKLSSEKEEYSRDEKIVTTISVKNTNILAVKNISVEGMIPEGYIISVDSELKSKIDLLEPGETTCLTIAYESKKIEPNSNSISENTSKSESNNIDNKSNNLEPNSNSISENTSKSESNNIDNKSNTPKMGDISKVKLWSIIFGFALVVSVIVILLKKKKGKKIFIFLLICSLITTGKFYSVYASELKNNSISISVNVKVDETEISLNAIVKYDKDIKLEELKKPENPSEADEYYWGNSKVIEVINVKESETVLTEKEVISLLEDRGFVGYPITYEYSMDGEYDDETEVVSESLEKHPMYQTFYVSENGEVWTIFIINGEVFANPVSFNAESELDVQLLFSESSKLTSYNNEVNKFYVTIPYESSVIVKEVNRIDSDELDKITVEEIRNYEK